MYTLLWKYNGQRDAFLRLGNTALEQNACVGAAYINLHNHNKNKNKYRSKRRW